MDSEARRLERLADFCTRVGQHFVDQDRLIGLQRQRRASAKVETECYRSVGQPCRQLASGLAWQEGWQRKRDSNQDHDCIEDEPPNRCLHVKSSGVPQGRGRVDSPSRVHHADAI